MKRVLLHIGYPKTGTTTMQEEVFVNLHNKGLINYLGRTVKSSHTRFGNSIFNGIDFVMNFRRQMYFGEPLNLDSVMLSDDILNVISDENLSFHDFYHYAQSNRTIDYQNFPSLIKKILGNDVQFQLLVTIRNQSDLIYSSFSQKFRFLLQYFGEFRIEDFLTNKLGYLNRSQYEHLLIYDFEHYLHPWENELNSKAVILFFEDLTANIDNFCTTLSGILPISKDELITIFESKHYRKRHIEKNYVIGYKKMRKPFQIISKLMPPHQLERKFEKFFYVRASVFLNILNKIIYRHLKYELPSFSDGDKTAIQNRFNESNLEFAHKRHLPIESMIKYGYISKHQFK